jgi:hypothetical protein
MSNYVKLATEASDSYFAALNETQENFLKSVAAFTAFMPAAPTGTAQGPAELPTVHEITEANFSFAQKFLRQQQDFVEKLIAASAPSSRESVSSRNAPLKSKSAPAS